MSGLLIVGVPARPVAQFCQQGEGCFRGNVHLCVHPEAQHALLLKTVKANLGQDECSPQKKRETPGKLKKKKDPIPRLSLS